jgi:hypothetical protein
LTSAAQRYNGQRQTRRQAVPAPLTAFAAWTHRWPFVEISLTAAVILRRSSHLGAALRRQKSLAEPFGSAALLRQRPSERAAILRQKSVIVAAFLRQESLKPAANFVGQHLTNVRGKASHLFSWVERRCASTWLERVHNSIYLDLLRQDPSTVRCRNFPSRLENYVVM